MLSTEEKAFNEARRKVEVLVNLLRNAYTWYEGASEEEKNSIKYDGDTLQYLKFEVPFMSDIKDYIKDDTEEDKDIEKKEDLEVDYVDILNKYMDLFFDLQDAMKELKRAEIALEPNIQSDKTDNSFLEQNVSGNIISKEIYDTSILDDYRPWGIERICLDGVQNHLPEDSKGTICLVQFLIDGEWVSLENAKDKRDKIKEIRFVDDGVGFSAKQLRYLSSQKTSEDKSIGQFGEGLKLVSMACVNLGVELEVQSKNWTAKAFGKDVSIENNRNGEQVYDNHKQLAWDVTEYDGMPIKRI